MTKRRSISIGWVQCQIDDKTHIQWCAICQLLGHSTAKCPNKEAPKTKPAAKELCLDCVQYNAHQWMLHNKNLQIALRKRPTNHCTGYAQCPMLRAFQVKALPTVTRQQQLSMADTQQ